MRRCSNWAVALCGLVGLEGSGGWHAEPLHREDEESVERRWAAGDDLNAGSCVGAVWRFERERWQASCECERGAGGVAACRAGVSGLLCVGVLDGSLCAGDALAGEGGDPMNRGAWTKSSEPVFQGSAADSVFLPGHNGFFTSPDEKESWIVYHANPEANQGCGGHRSPRAQRFRWNGDGTPDFGRPISTATPIAMPSGDPR